MARNIIITVGEQGPTGLSGFSGINGAYVPTPGTTVANLVPAATAGQGARAFVVDALPGAVYSIVIGGGSDKRPVVSDGTNWLIG